MISCRHCNATNRLDSRFCRACGEALPADDLEVALDDNTKLIEDGRDLLATSRVGESIMIAERVLESQPESVPALTLLGDALERDGRIDDALEAYERIVEIRPDSPLDKIRVTHLRRVLAERGSEQRGPIARKYAAVVSVAAALLLFSVAAAMILANSNDDPSADDGAMPELTGDQAFGYSGQTSLPNGGGGQFSSGPQEPIQEPVATEQSEPSDRPRTEQYRFMGPQEPLPNEGRSVGTLPLPGDGSYDPGNVPVQVPPGLRIEPEPGTSRDPDPEASRGGEQADRPRGVVQISPSQNNGGSSSGTSERDSENEAETLSRVARQHYIMGNFAKAAEAFEKSIQAGAGSGSNYQRLAQCYEKLNQRSKAISAYQSAIRVLEGQISRGAANPDKLRAQIDSCRQALAVLQRA